MELAGGSFESGVGWRGNRARVRRRRSRRRAPRGRREVGSRRLLLGDLGVWVGCWGRHVGFLGLGRCYGV